MWKGKKTSHKEADITIDDMLRTIISEITGSGYFVIDGYESDKKGPFHCDGSEYNIHVNVKYSALEKFGHKTDLRNKVYERIGDPIEKELDVKLKTNNKLRDYRYEVEAFESLDI